MKKLFALCFICFGFLFAQAQLTQDTLSARKKIKVSGYGITEFSNDSTLSAQSPFYLPTQYAVYSYIQNHLVSGGGSSVDWSAITGKPNSVAGYGIGDAVSTSNPYYNPAWIASLNWNKLVGTPTTLSGYGIADAYPLSGNPSNFLTSITSSNVTTALGFTPYNSTNPNGYVTSSALSSYVPTSTTITINGTTKDLTANQNWTISGGGSSAPQPQYYGSIYNKNTWTATTDFVTNNITAVVSSNKIAITSGTGLSTLDYNYYSELDHWSNAGKIKATSTSAIFGVGMHSHSSYQGFSVFAKFNCGTGVLSIINGNTVPSYAETTLVTATSTLTVSANDYVIVSLERDVDSVFATVRDVTSGSSIVKVAYGYQVNTTSNMAPNTGMYAVYAGGNSFTIDSMAVSSNEIVNSNLLITTDSKGAYVADTYKSRWTQQVSNLYYPTVLSIGGTEGINDLLNRLPEIIALAPKSALVLLGRNDQQQAMNSDTLHNRYIRATDTLQAHGITVWHLNDFYETVLDLTALSHWKNTTFTGYVINTFDPTSQVGTPFLSADNVHQNQAGHDFVAKIIIQSGAFNNGLNYANAIRLNTPPYPIGLNNIGGNQFIGGAGNNTLSTATNNLGWGAGAGASLTTGLSNINIGVHAGNILTTDNTSIFFGNYAGYLTQGAKYNIFIGDHAGVNALDAATHAEASRNIFIGAWGGTNVQTMGKDNVYIGNYAGQFFSPNAGVSNTLMISGGSTGGSGGSGFGTTGSAFDGHDIIFGNFNTGGLRVGLDASTKGFGGATYPLVTGITLDVNGGTFLLPRHNGTSGLPTTTDGTAYYDTAAHSIAFWNGVEWHNVTPQHSFITMTEGGNPNLFGNNFFYVLKAASDLTAITITLGKTVFNDNNVLTLIPKVNVAAVTWNSYNGSSTGASNCVGCPSSLTAGQRFTLIYDKGTDSWY